MSEDNNYTRRRLLGATVGIGAVGAGAGAVTGAYLSDWRPFTGNTLVTGTFDLELATATAESVGDLSTFSDDEFESTTEIVIDHLSDLEPGDEGIIRVGCRLLEAPGWVWVRAAVEGDSELGDHLYAEIKERPACGDGDGIDLFEGSLTELVDPDVSDSFDGGRRLGDDCATDEHSCLDLEWEFDTESDGTELSGESLSLSLEFAAVQCRHTDSTENPWN